jgi:hypothetical protein
MEPRVDTQDELPGIGLLRALAALRAELQVVIDGVVERLDDLGDGIPLEGNRVAEADHVPEEGARILVELDNSCIALVLLRQESRSAFPARQIFRVALESPTYLRIFYARVISHRNFKLF